jgi:hypothetical protein
LLSALPTLPAPIDPIFMTSSHLLDVSLSDYRFRGTHIAVVDRSTALSRPAERGYRFEVGQSVTD